MLAFLNPEKDTYKRGRMTPNLPKHLQKYVVDQSYDRYTPIDQAAWRYVLRQLVFFLSHNAHPSYLDGLKATGISIDKIPSIEEISNKLQEFGWKAVPVSGFIPPAAFMEFQSLGYLPIASDMRSTKSLMYTPAPDIVHEAAGHAPIISHPEYAAYLKRYASVAKKAIISHEDINLYKAIRDLSDIKENPSSTTEEIQQAETNLKIATEKMTFVSEAAQLGRMNWWTAEYGLIGDLDSPKIFGAGILSSIEESRMCLQDSVKKIPLSIDCINYSYDITEPQPQLFVAQNFEHLSDVLNEFASTMAYQKGGVFGLDKIKEAQNVNTAVLTSGLQISGQLVDYKTTREDNQVGNQVDTQEKKISYLQFSGPTQLCYADSELEGHSRDFHSAGYGTAIGQLKGQEKPLEDWTAEDFESAGWKKEQQVSFEFESGVKVDGVLKNILTRDQKNLILTFDACSVTLNDQVLFDPDWGIYDLGLGLDVVSTFGGPADRRAYGDTVDFVAQVIPFKEHSEKEKDLHKIYVKIRELRAKIFSDTSINIDEDVTALCKQLETFPEDWLASMELFEIFLHHSPKSTIKESLEQHLTGMCELHEDIEKHIRMGIQVAQTFPLIYEQ